MWRAIFLIGAILLPLSAPQAGNPDQVTLVFTGESKGYIEPCGCSDNLLGGLPRRDAVVTALRDKGENVLLIDNGDVMASYSEQDRLKFDFILGAMKKMDYALINLGARDLAWEQEILDTVIMGSGIKILRGQNAPATAELHVGGVTFFVIGVIDPALVKSDNSRNLQAELSQLLEEGPKGSFRIILFQGDFKKAEALAEAVPGAHLIISGRDQEDPVYPKMVNGTWVLNYASKGKYLAISRVEKKPDGAFNISNEMMALDKDVAESDSMHAFLESYDEILEEQEMVLKYANRISLDPGQRFQGSQKCEACHAETFANWKMSHHSSAYDTLVGVGKNNDPECVACHTVGYGRVSGFSRPDKRPDLRGVGCESCHGAGYPHRKDPENFAMVLDPGVCASSCHIPDHSPKFDFSTYWPKLKH